MFIGTFKNPHCSVSNKFMKLPRQQTQMNEYFCCYLHLINKMMAYGRERSLPFPTVPYIFTNLQAVFLNRAG
jgi:hypothetical protein